MWVANQIEMWKIAGHISRLYQTVLLVELTSCAVLKMHRCVIGLLISSDLYSVRACVCECICLVELCFVLMLLMTLVTNGCEAQMAETVCGPACSLTTSRSAYGRSWHHHLTSWLQIALQITSEWKKWWHWHRSVAQYDVEEGPAQYDVEEGPWHWHRSVAQYSYGTYCSWVKCLQHLSEM